MERKQPLVSVLMPVFNTAAFVKQAIESRIRLLPNKQNMGIAVSRKRLLEAAQGEFLALMDSDDISLTGRSRAQLEVMRNEPGVWASSGHNEIIDEGGKVIGFRRYSLEPEKNLLHENPFSHPFSMIRADAMRQL